jgi:hypothetical protein
MTPYTIKQRCSGRERERELQVVMSVASGDRLVVRRPASSDISEASFVGDDGCTFSFGYTEESPPGSLLGSLAIRDSIGNVEHTYVVKSPESRSDGRWKPLDAPKRTYLAGR